MARRLVTYCAATLITYCLSAPAIAAELTGPAQVVDGGRIVIAGRNIALSGLIAPNLDHLCRRGGQTWRCGEAAAFALAGLIERHWLTCTTGQDSAGSASCRMGGPKGVDIGLAMVRQGWAEARPGSGYESAEREARAATRGLWAAR